ncbi:nucleoside/nucleotide kinase family protein [Nocardia goodfellowii]|uniref:Pantothenate kinase n=1 Tax=Nocardia goodfellowii TaxID=882446 RepID=A0ABS4QBA4_9NOCA|nr:nucleoside/nucleotide kinase family protein [Nocardia goodfellowii]MBP2188984.1 pantothenate kinase [Nocardia goodfellowii]
MTAMSWGHLAERVSATAGPGRYLLGVAGPPGAGKSTFAAGLRDALNTRAGEPVAAVAPMDGYHLRNAELRAAGTLARKGEPETFDAAGFVQNLRRLRDTPVGTPVPWPTFDRGVDEPTPGGIVFTEQRIVIVEGNYLLLDDADGQEWSSVRKLLDECWYLDADRRLLEKRLLRRHIRGGRTVGAARLKVQDTDFRNADRIAATRDRADLVLRGHQGRYYLE